MYTFGALETFDLVGHENVSSLGLGVTNFGGVDSFQVKVFEVDVAAAVRARGYVDHAGVESWSAGGEQCGQEKVEEEKVPEMVGAKLGFKAVFCCAFGRVANP
jgi:hypothetical protein